VSKRKLWSWLLAALVVWLMLRWCTAPVDEAGAAAELVDHPWLERPPRGPRDPVEHLLFLEQRGRRFGVVGKSSAYRLHLDVIRWKLEGDRLRVKHLQDREERGYRVRTWSCPKEAPKGFDLCLELTGSTGESRRFYSRRGLGPKDAAALSEGVERFFEIPEGSFSEE
jgi:hypothetical protein